MGDPSDAGVRVIGGRYRLLERLGQGGMGTVWKAHDEVLGRTVAVKEVDLPQLNDADKTLLRERTMREARAAARMAHPNAVTVYDVVEDGGKPWIIMALVAADSLADVVRDHGPLPPGQVAEIGLAVLSALQAAHAAGILHRDVKPGNVLLGRDGQVVLTDFGIATLEGDPSLTSTGLLLGAPAYIAPERARGLEPGPASDLWSLGATMYTAVEGRPPYDRDTPLATLTALMTEEPPAPRNAGPLTAVLRGLLEHDPKRRPDAGTTRRMLEQALGARLDQPGAGLTLPVAVAVAGEAPANDEPVAPAVKAADRTQVIPRRDLPEDPVVGPAVVPASAPPRVPAAPPPRVPASRPAPGRLRPALLGLLALGLAGAVVAAVLLSNSGKPNRNTAKGSTSPTPTAAAGGGAGSTSHQPSPAATSTTPSAPAKSAGAAGGAGIPAGFTKYTDPTGFSVAVPNGWQRSASGTRVDFHDPGSARFLRFDQTSQPKGDPVADWTTQEKSVSKRLPNYQRIFIKSVQYRGWSTADWEFTFGSGSGTTRVRDRGFVVDASHGYAIYLSGPADSWDQSLTYFDAAAATFQPAS
ncbi:MAG: serine/threonine protein kinase [Actinomycetota bacterium]|nr:serine/threonine protein kinase [Actinomycetota bacterium]